MESRTENRSPLSLQEIHHKFNNLKVSLAIEIESDSEAKIHPLMRAVEELWYCKSIKFDLDCYIHSQTQQQALGNVNELVRQLRETVREEINQTSVDDLLSMSIDLGRERNNTLLEFLAEIGEAYLFNHARAKLADRLCANDYIYIYSILRQAYIGSQHSESIGLGFIDLARGNQVYVQIIRDLMVQLKNIDHDFFSCFTNVMNRAPLKQTAISKKVFLDKNTFVEGKLIFYIDRFSEHEEIIFNKLRKKAQLEELYKEYVLSHNEMNLMDEFESNYLSKRSKVNPHGFLSTNPSLPSHAPQDRSPGGFTCVTM